jgi:hypothetical protein
LNIKTFEIIGISNLIDYNIASTYNVSPNASDRLVPETHVSSGVSSYKYQTKTVVLADPAVDLRIIVDVHKPQDSDFDIYVKTVAPYKQELIDNNNWVKVEGVWKDFSCITVSEYRKVEATLSDLMPDIFGESEFKEFKIKLVGKAKNSAKPVLFKNLIAIAVI